jgi:hypothetical protein
MIESQSFFTHSQVSARALAELVAELALEPVDLALVVDEVVGRVGALGAHADDVLSEGSARDQRDGRGQEVAVS